MTRDIRRALTPLRNALGIVNPDVLGQIRRELRDHVAREGKFSKLESLYLPFTPFPPGVWLYDCVNCELYQQQRTCEIVEGNISPLGWCGFWVSRVGDKPLSWVTLAVSR